MVAKNRKSLIINGSLSVKRAIYGVEMMKVGGGGDQAKSNLICYF